MVDSAAVPTGKMQAGIQVWSTDDNRGDDGVAYWRERVRIATAGLFDISADVEIKRFAAPIGAVQLHGGRVDGAPPDGSQPPQPRQCAA
jgi:hypothetical protein